MSPPEQLSSLFRSTNFICTNLGHVKIRACYFYCVMNVWRSSSAKTFCSVQQKHTRGKRSSPSYLKIWLHRLTSPLSSNRHSILSMQKKVPNILYFYPEFYSNLGTAESKLKNEARTQPDFLTNLLTLIAAPQVALPIRQAAALFFKNFVRQNWKVRHILSSMLIRRMMNNNKSSPLQIATSSNLKSLH